MRMELSAILPLLGSLQLVIALRFSPVTDEVGLSDSVGRIAALADFNADKVTDILLLNSTGSDHSILLWSIRTSSFVHNPITLDVPGPITEVRTGDFDGDGVVDILTLHGDGRSSEVKGHRPCYTAIVHRCRVVDDKDVTVYDRSTSVLPNISSPTVLDINGDHVPDLFAIVCSDDPHTPTFFISSASSASFNFSRHILSPIPIPDLISSYFVDLDSDCLPELVLYRENNRVMEIWKIGESGMKCVLNQSLTSLLGSTVSFGLPAFADMDGDGVLEAVLFSCYDLRCNQTAVHVLHQKKEFGADVVRCKSSESWDPTFTKVVTVNLTGVSLDPLSLNLTQPVIGDLDLDGHPDVVTMVRSGHVEGQDGSGVAGSGQPRPLVLLGSAGGKLRPQVELFNEAAVVNVTQVMFFDLWEDGVLDVLMAQEGTPRGEGDVSPIGGKLVAYRQSLSEDHAFLKVLVLSGHCFSDCESERKPYGSVLPGATVSFSTTGRSGGKERSVAVVQYSGTNSLQLPFALFGLGETPNFIEDLTVGAGYSLSSDMENGNWTPRISLGYHQWSLLVPNSQVIVSLYPIDKPDKWHIELYLTPSHLVYSTAGVLCALAIGIAIIIGLLQAREKYQDSKEKNQAKHRFHFNAM